MEIVLNSYGAKLSINNGAFILNNSTGSHRIPIKDVDSILVAKSSVLTSDALILAIENGIRVTLADKGGNVMGCVWSHKYGSISTIRKGQLIFTASQDAVEWIKKVIIQSVNDYLSENESIKGMTRSRETHIFLYIQKFAQQLKHY